MDMITGDAFWQAEGRRPAWHNKLGGIVAQGAYPSETLQRMGNYNVERAALASWSEQDQQWYPIESHFALLREPIPSDPQRKSLGVVSSDYQVVQHMDLALAMDALVRAGWQLETCGLLYDGAQLFLTFASEGYVWNEDEIISYWCASVRHAASALNIFCTPVRIVCANTFNMGMGRATDRITIPHYSKALQELGWAVDVLKRAHAREAEIGEEMTALAATPMDVESYTQVLDATYKMPTPPRRLRAIQQRVESSGRESLDTDTLEEYVRLDESYEAKRLLMQRLRDAVAERVVAFNDTRPQYANTAWAVWNAVTEIESHRKGKSIGHQVLFGERGEAMAHAYRELVAVAAGR